MPRANRHFLPGFSWHITQRCHKREFLLKFLRDRKRWLYWLYQAKKRYGICVLEYNLTHNHIHLLALNKKKKNIISQSMNLVSSRTAQEYNLRKGRNGAFWGDRYHATAIETDSHLIQCMIYIALNMVRANVVRHPAEWPFCGYHEIQSSRQRYSIIDFNKLIELLGLKNKDELRETYRKWVNNAIESKNLSRESKWTENVAVGNKDFVENFKSRLA
jgi:putative transposase